MNKKAGMNNKKPLNFHFPVMSMQLPGLTNDITFEGRGSVWRLLAFPYKFHSQKRGVLKLKKHYCPK